MTGILRATLLGALLSCSLPTVAPAQQPSVDSLLRRIERLERITADLQLRVSELENPTTSEPSRAHSVPASQKWRDLQNWRRLRRGMKMDEVRAVLGEPGRVDSLGGLVTYWRYSSGHVQFGSSDKVEGWSEP